ncbi:MAG: DUF4834 domain-containing protein [Bacteroidota bacterium]|nr:DUF4834 domain-containing protein [Bacteroidota bacterium]
MIVGLFRILLIFLVVYYLFRFLSYLFKPSGSNYRSENGNMNKSSKKEGEVTIDYLPEADKKVQKDKGDYVDYEEVADKQNKNTD